MSNLAETIARLSALRSLHAGGSFPPEHDRLRELEEFGSNPGALSGRFYIPAGMPKNASLVVILHGCQQTAASYDYGSGWSTLADRFGFALLFPEQRRANNPNGCFNWFLPEDTRRGAGEAASIFQMIDRLILSHGLDKRRVFVTGLSAGGAMASAMLATYPEVFAGGAIIAGLPYGSAQTMPQAFERMRGQGTQTASELGNLVREASGHRGPWPIISIWHGSSDATVAPANALAITSQWREIHNLSTAPSRVRDLGPYRKRIWTNAQGRDVIEECTIAGMGHGTPLDVGPDGCGSIGPFMLDAGVSSTQEIARFWGIAPATTQNSKAPRHKPSQLPVPTTQFLKYRTSDRTKEAPKAGSPVGGVQKIIENALRAAGLMT